MRRGRGPPGELRIFEERFGHGVATLTEFADGSFRDSSSLHGAYHVSGDGREIQCLVDDGEPWKWRRFLIGKVLPLAALLSGLDHRRQARSPPRAARLSSRAARTLARRRSPSIFSPTAQCSSPDVVALERTGDEALAHPALGLIPASAMPSVRS